MNATTSLIDAELLGADAANGISYAYRRFGNAAAGVPVVFLQHFRGNIDNWDPALVDAVAADREVILFDNVGVGATSGTTPGTVEEMARDAVVFLDALGLSEVDLFGFSLGGFVAQEIALTRPSLVRRLILAGTGPKGAPGMREWSPDVVKSVVSEEDVTREGTSTFSMPTPIPAAPPGRPRSAGSFSGRKDVTRGRRSNRRKRSTRRSWRGACRTGRQLAGCGTSASPR
jgi:pimeloyl-ACP methyl ester carboxylesterase